jgi:Lon protease-like protein
MFESILYGPKPWCFGHLFLEGGSRNLRSDQPEHQLETWETTTRGPKLSSSAVVGCLMNISDYRRMSDGRLLLLVHAMERFVVTDIQQRLPYSIVTAQMLPDAEEMDPHLEFGTNIREEDLTQVRAMAIEESVRFHDYEYDVDHVLPVPDRPDLAVSDIMGSAIAKVLPYCPFSKTLEPPVPRLESFLPAAASDGDHDAAATSPPSDPLQSLEYRLLCRGIFQTPLIDPEFTQRQDLTTGQLEYELWLAINNFLITTRMPVSPIFLGLLPPQPEQDWPASFVLPQIVADLCELDSLDHDFVQVSADYPAHRRQRRLSFSAAHLLETNGDVAQELRPLLLATPSTKQRLRMVLERLDQWQQTKWGKFQ